MTSITIRNLDSGLKGRLRVDAARHGHSMEQEARELLRSALSRKSSESRNLRQTIRTRFTKLGGVVLPELKRDAMRKPLEFRR